MDLHKLGLTHFCDIYSIPPVGDYSLEFVEAQHLITAERIDLIAKLKYVEYKDKAYELDFVKDVYAHHLEAFTRGTYIEDAQPHKNSVSAYLQTFDALIEDISHNGLNPEISIVPVGANNVILEGAHRVAIAAYYKKSVPIIRFPHIQAKSDAAFFRDRLLNEYYLDYLVSEYCKHKDTIFLACLWPVAQERDKIKSALELLGRSAQMIYSKDVFLNYNGLKNLIPQIYVRHEWVGSIESRFRSAMPKVDGCYKKDKNTTVCLIEGSNLEEIRQLKEEVREIFNIQENSIHITDNIEETRSLVGLLLNPNSVHLLNYGDPYKYIGFNKALAKFKTEIQNNGADLEQFLLDSSACLGVYGIRKPDDLDYLTLCEHNIRFDGVDAHDHSSEIRYHMISKEALLFDPKNYAVYNDLKILSLRALMRFKRNRNEAKDRDDIKLLQSYLNAGSFNPHVIVIRVRNTINKKCRNTFFFLLKKFGLYEFARKIYRRLKNRR